MEINIRNKTFNGRWQWLYFIILDINDFMGCPLTFVIKDNNTFKNFHIVNKNWNKESGRYLFSKFLYENQK